MNRTKILGITVVVISILSFWAVKVEATLPFDNLRLISTNTPTPIPTIKMQRAINLDLLPTATPTPIIFKKAVDPNLIKVLTTETPKPTETAFVTVEVTRIITEEPTVTTAVAETTVVQTDTGIQNNSNSLTFWFLLVTIGLLAVIIVVQAWPKSDKKEEE